jgi:hypothetical protein
VAKVSTMQIVQARSVEEAWEKSRWEERYRKNKYVVVSDTIQQQLDALTRKESRAQSNATLYADRLRLYESIRESLETWVNAGKSDAEVVALLMLAHGDVRVDHPSLACITKLGPVDGTHWLVFGYAFS